MKKNFRIFAVLVAFMLLPFFFVGCGPSEEKAVSKEGEARQQAVGQKETKIPSKSVLPKKLMNLGLTDEQRAKCEAAYQEIFTSDILAQRKKMQSQLKGMKEDSEEYMKLKKEIREKFKPYYGQFNKKLSEILTREQQDKYFAKK